MRSPIERLVDSVVRCVKCGTQGVGNCDCWGSKRRACAVCGCIDTLACPGGCWWVALDDGADVCSSCLDDYLAGQGRRP